jgi:hypothetical protein
MDPGTYEEGTMFDDPRDVNRGLENRDPYQYGNLPREGSGYALPVALLAIVLIIGGLIAFAPTSTQQTASNDPAVTRSTPAPSPAPVPIVPPKTTAPTQ